MVPSSTPGSVVEVPVPSVRVTLIATVLGTL